MESLYEFFKTTWFGHTVKYLQLKYTSKYIYFKFLNYYNPNLFLQEHYSHFCSHITCEAMYNEHLVPVTNRRCLCELAKQIGFSDHAEEIFKLEQQLSTFRHLVNILYFPFN